MVLQDEARARLYLRNQTLPNLDAVLNSFSPGANDLQLVSYRTNLGYDVGVIVLQPVGANI